MPAIWNIGNINEANNKKVSSKLTFEVGESFKGKIISKGEGNEVVVKLIDGWQFTAEIEGQVTPQEEGLVRFVVEDFEGGKIKLKIMPSRHTKQSSEGNIIGDFMEKTGMTKENLDILKAMVKYNIPLTKDNITFIKSITSFNEKINSNPEEIDNFISKFIAGKGIEEGSTKGQQIKEVLNDFFKSFKTVNKEDILFFIENNIDINKENINSFNKLFKSEETIKEYFDNISKSLKELNVDLTDSKTRVENNEEALIPKTIQSSEEKSPLGNNELASKTYNSNNTDKGKVSMLSLLKSMAGSDVELTKETIEETLNLSSKDIIREDIKVKIENMKDVIKNIIAHAELKGEGMEKVMQFIKGNISDFKLLNSVNNEYYYLDVPINSNGEEYPCKLIIKDSRKDNKRIDTTNVKLILAVKTLNLGTVDGYLKVNGTNLNVNIKCEEEFVKVINKTKEKLLEGLKTLGFFTSITVTPKKSDVSLTTCRGFFEENRDRAIDTKV